MIRVFTGKPRQGKSYHACCWALEELRDGERNVVTNLPLDLSEMNAYFQRPKMKFADVYKRVQILSKAEAQQFWRYRGPGFESAGPGMNDLEAFWASEAESSGVLYIIDEAHLLFDARTFKSSEQALTVYNSQHAKLRDDCIFVTQFLGLIEKRVRGFAEYFHVFRNFKGVKTMQLLRMPVRIREQIYSVEPGGPGVKPDEEHWHKMDLAKANCYHTMTGIGLAGGKKLDKRETKGLVLPWWIVLVAIGGIGCGIVLLPKLLAGRLASGFMKVASPHVGPAVELPVPSSSIIPPKASEIDSSAGMIGYVIIGDSVEVRLSDGRILTKSDISILRKDRVVDRGGRVYLKIAPSRPVEMAVTRAPAGEKGSSRERK
jgi:hypothetical protein